MTEARLTLRYVVIDVADLDRSAAFWSALLEVPVIGRDARYAWLERQQRGAPSLVLQRVDEPKVGKARCHVDLQPVDRVAARDRAVSLGAVLVREVVEPGYQLSVLTDPEGVEFCIIGEEAEPGRSASAPAD